MTGPGGNVDHSPVLHMVLPNVPHARGDTGIPMGWVRSRGRLELMELHWNWRDQRRRRDWERRASAPSSSPLPRWYSRYTALPHSLCNPEQLEPKREWRLRVEWRLRSGDCRGEYPGAGKLTTGKPCALPTHDVESVDQFHGQCGFTVDQFHAVVSELLCEQFRRVDLGR